MLWVQKREKGNTNSVFSQSIPAGHRSAPVTGWWKPRVDLTFRNKGGFKDSPRGQIHSSTAPFRLFVSSDLAEEMPFWICKS